MGVVPTTAPPQEINVRTPITTSGSLLSLLHIRMVRSQGEVIAPEEDTDEEVEEDLDGEQGNIGGEESEEQQEDSNDEETGRENIPSICLPGWSWSGQYLPLESRSEIGYNTGALIKLDEHPEYRDEDASPQSRRSEGAGRRSREHVITTKHQGESPQTSNDTPPSKQQRCEPSTSPDMTIGEDAQNIATSSSHRDDEPPPYTERSTHERGMPSVPRNTMDFGHQLWNLERWCEMHTGQVRDEFAKTREKIVGLEEGNKRRNETVGEQMDTLATMVESLRLQTERKADREIMEDIGRDQCTQNARIADLWERHSNQAGIYTRLSTTMQQQMCETQEKTELIGNRVGEMEGRMEQWERLIEDRLVHNVELWKKGVDTQVNHKLEAWGAKMEEKFLQGIGIQNGLAEDQITSR